MLTEWISQFKIVEPLTAREAARQFLKDSGQAVSESAINRVIVELHELGLLLGKPNSPGTYTRITRC